mgnify:CR=1 FL=1
MKKLLFFLFCFPIIANAQYSNYYKVDANINKNVNVNANINKNVNVTGTISTIDFGALANANAQREANRLSRMQYANQRAKEAAIAIANDPSKAYDYGVDNNWKLDSKIKKQLGWGRKIKYMYHKIPHNSLFDKIGDNYNYENISEDGVKTQVIINSVATLKVYRKSNPSFSPNFEELFEFKDFTEGELNNFNDVDGKKTQMLHKKDIKRANVGGNDGFRGTIIWEDKYEKTITDNYGSYINRNGETYIFNVKVRYKGDVDEVTFEQLEGRRYYFRKLVDRMISTIKIY